MYYPKHRPQLVNIATAAVDCGVRATQMALDWVSKGKVIRSVETIRRIGKMGDGPTNYDEWDTVIDELGGKTEGFSGTKVSDWSDAAKHLRNGGASILAVHYGTYRRSMPSKSGSLTFNDYHAILMVGERRRGGQSQTRSFDSLLDGRYKGCPNGPVWVPMWKVKNAATAVGQREAGTPRVYAVNLNRDASVGGIDIPDDGPDTSFVDIISDLHSISLPQGSIHQKTIDQAIDNLEALIGASVEIERDGREVVVSGVKLK